MLTEFISFDQVFLKKKKRKRKEKPQQRQKTNLSSMLFGKDQIYKESLEQIDMNFNGNNRFDRLMLMRLYFGFRIPVLKCPRVFYMLNHELMDLLIVEFVTLLVVIYLNKKWKLHTAV